MLTSPPLRRKRENINNQNTKIGGFTPINVVISKKMKKPDFKIFGIQKKCVDCEKIFLEEFKIKNINIININKNILTISCKNKIISNEIQLRKKNIIDKIKEGAGINIFEIRVI